MFISFRLAEFFERYREFISTLAFRLSTMHLPVASWSAHERQRFYSIVAAVLAQYIDILVCGRGGLHGPSSFRSCADLCAVSFFFFVYVQAFACEPFFGK